MRTSITISIRFVLAALIAALHASTTLAQPPPEQSDPPDEPGKQEQAAEVVRGEGQVEVDDRPADTRIQRRIRDVLDSTERFQALEVEVRDGVVFLRGTALTTTDRQLATDLASRTAGVAVVVNNLTLPAEPTWTLEPAFDELNELLRTFIRALPLIIAGLAVLLAFIILARLIGAATDRFIARTTDSQLLRNVLRKAVFLFVAIIGLYLALRITGLTRIALTVISGTGLLGLALGFAFRDIAENFLASLLLSIQRPFRLGDVVEVDGHTGIVRKVTSRGTLLIDFDGNHIQIANATVYKNTIKNYTANPLVRIHFLVGIGYDEVITKAQDITRHALDEHPAVLQDPEPLVLVEELGASTVNLRVYCWINGAEHSMLKAKSSVTRLVLRALTDAGISMPDEAREVIFPQGVPVQIADPSSTGTAPPAPPEAATRQDHGDEHDAEIIVEAEGDLTTETASLKRQADQARDPEEGQSVI